MSIRHSWWRYDDNPSIMSEATKIILTAFPVSNLASKLRRTIVAILSNGFRTTWMNLIGTPTTSRIRLKISGYSSIALPVPVPFLSPIICVEWMVHDCINNQRHETWRIGPTIGQGITECRNINCLTGSYQCIVGDARLLLQARLICSPASGRNTCLYISIETALPLPRDVVISSLSFVFPPIARRWISTGF